jgi:cold shock CspA family protein
LDDKAAMAKAMLENVIQNNKLPAREKDPRVLEAQRILSQAAGLGQDRDQANGQPIPASSGIAGDSSNTQGDQDEILSKLPFGHKKMLRQYFQDQMTGEWQPYFVGTLKSFSSKSGYGFLACNLAFQYYGADVFVHKSQVPMPWALGQPVEFAVMSNQRGQPQATDCLWLPKIPQMRTPMQRPAPVQTAMGGYASSPNAGVGLPQPGSFSPHDPSAPAPLPSNGASGMAAGKAPIVQAVQSTSTTGSAGPAESQQVTPLAERSAEGPYYLGTLKSFSSAQGYGFLQCDDVFKKFQRDIYFDRSQLPRPPIYTQGQTVEFAVTQNSRGQPQARNLIWECIPVLPSDAAEETASEANSQPKKHSAESLDKLRKLLRLLNEQDKDQAIVTAIDLAGHKNTANPTAEDKSASADVDYVTFVLDRLGSDSQAVSKIKDFVKMLLCLMISKMLKTGSDLPRMRKLTGWLHQLADAIDPSSAQVQEPFHDVVSQIEENLQKAPLQDADISKKIDDVLSKLKAKVSGEYDNGN